MGNCLRNNKVLAQDHEIENYGCEEKFEEVKTFPPSKLEDPSLKQCMKKKNKKVRFKIENDGDGDSRSGAVRIRVVMTQEELKRMLSYKDDSADPHTSLEQLLCAIELRGGKFSVSDVSEFDGGTNSWRPALESIPEERLLK